MKTQTTEFNIENEYTRKKIVKLIDNIQESFYNVDPSQIYKLYSFTNADDFINWARKNKKITKIKPQNNEVDIVIDLSCVKMQGLVAS